MVDPVITLLPQETALHLLSYLDPYTLSQIRCVSSRWNRLICDEQLWRRVAIRLGYCNAPATTAVTSAAGTLQQTQPRPQGSAEASSLLEQTLERYKNQSVSRYFDACDSFQGLCRLLWQLECHWTGLHSHHPLQRPPSGNKRSAKQTFLRPYPCTHSVVLPNGQSPGFWRFKLDPVEKTIIFTSIDGAVTVVDAETSQVLWHLPTDRTRLYPHLEFSCGYMIFDRIGLDHFEVWKSERIAAEDEAHGIPFKRGQFRPHARLSSPRPLRAYRFQYPVLAAATRDGAVSLWHVPDRRLFQTIDISASAHSTGNINYIDFDDEYVFLIGDGAKNITVFSRATSHKVWDLGEHFERGHAGPSTWKAVGGQWLRAGPTFGLVEWEAAPPGAWQSSALNRMNDAQVTMKPYQCWSAVHPDVKTNTLLVLGQGSLLLLRDYKKFFQDTSKWPEAFEELLFRHPMAGIFDDDESAMRELLAQDPLAWNSRDLVWNNSPTALLAVHDGKAFCFNLHTMLFDLERPGKVAADTTGTTAEPPAPCCSAYMNVSRLLPGAIQERLYRSSCAQMDDTRAFYVDDSDERETVLCSLDLARMKPLSDAEDDESEEEMDVGEDEDENREASEGAGDDEWTEEP